MAYLSGSVFSFPFLDSAVFCHLLGWYQQTMKDGREIVQAVGTKLEWLLLAFALDLLKLS